MLVRALMGLLFLFSLTGSAQAMDNPYRLLTSAELPAFFTSTLPAFWQQHAQPGEFSGVDGVPIRYVALRNPASHRAILLVNGRLESYIKYQELAFNLFQQGYSVYLYDHRGQGFSGRMLSDPHKGYVQHFADYVTDLKTFHDQVVLADQPNQLYLLSHSMGGAIAAHYRDIVCPGGWLVFEIGCAQRADVMEICRQNGWQQVQARKDYGGNDRVVYAQRVK